MLRNSTKLLRTTLLFSTFLVSHYLISQPLLGFSTVTDGFTNPVDIVAEPGTSRFFVVEQGGSIRILDGTDILPTAFLTVSGDFISGGERGLLSMAFHPNYTDPANRYFFVYYNNSDGDITLARYRRDAVNSSLADPTSGVVLLTIPKPFANHNGGKLNFGPDGNLYFATGDGGSSDDPEENAQDGSSLLGKMIRLNVDDFATPPFYTIPANPFSGSGTIRDEIFALGLRNPWRWSFDTNGDIWIADVGQNNWEEVNHVTGAFAATGLNYGWRCREGLHANPNIPACTPAGGTTEDPIFEYIHNSATGGFSITGGYVYRGTDPINAALVGHYVCADYVSGNVWTVLPDGSSNRQTGLQGNVSGFGLGNDGELYGLVRGTAGTGEVFRVVVTGVLPVRLVRFSGDYFPGYNALKWTTAYEENADKFIIEYSTNGADYAAAGTVASTRNTNGDTYSFRHYINISGTVKYRLRILDMDQSQRLSPVIAISRTSREIKIYPGIITDNFVHIITHAATERMEIFRMDGQRVFTKAMNGITGYSRISLPSLQKGMYLIRLSGKDFQKTEKVIVQ